MLKQHKCSQGRELKKEKNLTNQFYKSNKLQFQIMVTVQNRGISPVTTHTTPTPRPTPPPRHPLPLTHTS